MVPVDGLMDFFNGSTCGENLSDKRLSIQMINRENLSFNDGIHCITYPWQELPAYVWPDAIFKWRNRDIIDKYCRRQPRKTIFFGKTI